MHLLLELFLYYKDSNLLFLLQIKSSEIKIEPKKTRPQKSYGHWVSLVKPTKFEEFRLLELTSLDQLPL